MFDKAILENGGTLESVPDCYKNMWYSCSWLPSDIKTCPWLLNDSENLW